MSKQQVTKISPETREKLERFRNIREIERFYEDKYEFVDPDIHEGFLVLIIEETTKAHYDLQYVPEDEVVALVEKLAPALKAKDHAAVQALEDQLAKLGETKN